MTVAVLSACTKEGSSAVIDVCIDAADGIHSVSATITLICGCCRGE